MRIQPYEPGLGDFLAVMPANEPGHSEGQTESGLDCWMPWASAFIGVLLNSTSFANARDVCHELRAKNVDQFLRNEVERRPRRVIERFEIGPWGGPAGGYFPASLPDTLPLSNHIGNTALETNQSHGQVRGYLVDNNSVN